MLSAAAPPPAVGGRSWARRVARTSDLLLRTLYVTTALVGLLVTPPVIVLLVVPAIALGSVIVLAGFIWYLEQHWPARHTLTTTATVTAAWVPFGQAVQVLQGVGTAISLVVLGLLTILGISWIRRVDADATRSATPGTHAGGNQSLRELLHVVPLELVFTEWRALEEPSNSRSSQPDRNVAAQTRTLLLDEMQRRDPTGFANWLAVGATTFPEEHIRGDHGLAA